MDFSKLSTNNWLAAGGGLVTLISGFLPWFKIGGDLGFGNVLGIDTSLGGFNTGFLGWAGILLVLAGGVVSFLKVMDMNDVKIQNLTAEQVAMVLAGLGAVFIVLRVLIGFTGWSRSWGAFVAVIAAAATVAGAFLSAKDAGIGIPSADDFTGGGDDAAGGSTTF